jgi:tetratricopeptide (TPR) repeat protein
MLRALCLTALCACAGGLAGPPESLRGLPPRHDPPMDLDDDDDLGRARAAYDALPLDAADRATERRALVDAYRRRIERAGDNRDEAFTRFVTLVSLWDARELGDPTKPAPDLALVEPAADALFQRASSTGRDLEAVTALAVRAAIHPEKLAEYDRTWKDIVAYTNDLAVAEAGPGAERSRAIQVLESVLADFPSRWIGDKLVALYQAREDSISKALRGGAKVDVLGSHRDPGVARPVWNLIRAYAHMHRLADAAPVVAQIDGQFGDEPELRKRLSAALDAKATGHDYLALMAAYLPSDPHDTGDAATALDLCIAGAERLPDSVDARKCAAEIARVTERIPLAIRWAEDARRLAPDDHDVAEILARLQLARAIDLVQAERLDAAGRRMTEIEAFYADAGKRWPGKALGVTLADAYTSYGRGLYNQGEVDAGVGYLQRAQKLEPSPAVTEELATVALKTGRFADAERGFLDAAAKPRPTPIETTFEKNRLRRLAGEAAAAAGQVARAKETWRQTLGDWSETLSGASLSPRARATAYGELGRLEDDLGKRDKSLEAMHAALDVDPEQAAVYGDVVAFLATRSDYDEALDAYHRALARPEVTEYLKVYTSLWVAELGRIRKAPEDHQVMDFLAGAAKGGRWYNQLARFQLGQIGFEALLGKADTRGKRAEAYFYEALARYAAGQRGRAEELLRQVVATQMLGFFEYDMARYYLRNGPPGTPSTGLAPE